MFEAIYVPVAYLLHGVGGVLLGGWLWLGWICSWLFFLCLLFGDVVVDWHVLEIALVECVDVFGYYGGN